MNLPSELLLYDNRKPGSMKQYMETQFSWPSSGQSFVSSGSARRSLRDEDVFVPWFVPSSSGTSAERFGSGPELAGS